MAQTQDQLGVSANPRAAPAEGLRSRPATRTGMFLAVLSKQIKDVRALKDDGGCFYVLLQAAVAPIGLEERVMGLKHSACFQMQDTLSATSKHSIIYILGIHSGICNGR